MHPKKLQRGDPLYGNHTAQGLFHFALVIGKSRQVNLISVNTRRVPAERDRVLLLGAIVKNSATHYNIDSVSRLTLVLHHDPPPPWHSPTTSALTKADRSREPSKP